MLQITKKVDYGLVALTHLALHPTERLSARELAETYRLSRTLMANCLKVLGRNGLLHAARGTKGGYALACDPAEVTVGLLVELLDAPLQLADCLAGPGQGLGCEVSRVCPVKKSVFKIQLQIRDVLFGTTIAELAREARQPGEALPVVASSPEKAVCPASAGSPQ